MEILEEVCVVSCARGVTIWSCLDIRAWEIGSSFPAGLSFEMANHLCKVSTYKVNDLPSIRSSKSLGTKNEIVKSFFYCPWPVFPLLISVALFLHVHSAPSWAAFRGLWFSSP